jgi:hypothetical protein
MNKRYAIFKPSELLKCFTNRQKVFWRLKLILKSNIKKRTG